MANRAKIAQFFDILPLLAVVCTVFFILSDLLEQTLLLSSSAWKFAVVILCFLYALGAFLLTHRGDHLYRRRGFLALAMGATLVSDFFLLLFDAHYEIGVATFILAQIFHACCISRHGNRKHGILILRICLPLAIIAALAVVKELTLLYALVAIYAVQLVMNLIEHLVRLFHAKRKSVRRRERCASIGFVLFFLCDFCVGLSNIGVTSVGFWIWVFYAPSQILIVYSLGRNAFNESSWD